MKDLYSILGVTKDSSKEAIKTAFKKQVISSHPDKGGNTEMAQELITAYHTLVDPEERRKFDDEWDLFQDMDEAVIAYLYEQYNNMAEKNKVKLNLTTDKGIEKVVEQIKKS